jgi:imidazole glycerol-phosphate synthase subunit HisH
MIAIIDYGMGNLGSVAKAFKAIGANINVIQNPKDLNKADKIVLPGVGAFRDCMLSLKKLKLDTALIENVKTGKPYLGLCLGMQILFETSEEGGKTKGLGILKGKIVRFNFKLNTQYSILNTLKIPHMGWNTIVPRPTSHVPRCKLLQNVPDDAWMYFVHSYYSVPEDKTVIAATTDYGMDFCSMIWKDNIYATQFHPEKSQQMGMKILENFIKL